MLIKFSYFMCISRLLSNFRALFHLKYDAILRIIITTTKLIVINITKNNLL